MMEKTLQAEFAGGTDRGLVRDHNEDSILYRNFPHSDVILLVVADGVGGHEGGEVASQLAVDTIQTVVGKSVLQANSGGGYGEHWLQMTLRHAVLEANRKIIEQQQAQAELFNMATTVVAILLKGSTLALSHLGDSRCYRQQDDRLQQMTEDHSMLQSMLNAGKIDQQQFETLPMRNVISQALGLKSDIDVETGIHELKDDETWLLCSDGLTNCVPDEMIQQQLQSTPVLADCVDQLITLANDNGGTDNISAVLLRKKTL